MPRYDCDASRPGRVLSLDLAGKDEFVRRRQRIFEILADHDFLLWLEDVTKSDAIRDVLDGVSLWMEDENLSGKGSNPQLYRKVKCGDLMGWIGFLKCYQDSDKAVQRKVRELGELFDSIRTHVKEDPRLRDLIERKKKKDKYKNVSPDRRAKRIAGRGRR